MSKEKILVTGGTGFIGSYLVRRLVESDYKVIVFDNNFRGSWNHLKDIQGDFEFIEGDIREKEDVKNAARGCQTMFHLAFINGTRYFYEHPELVLEVGVKGALNTLEVAMENGFSKYIVASSSEVYQQPTHVPTTEEERIFIPDVKNPRYSYGGGKIISELLTLNYLRGSSIHHCIFRPHNIFGPQMGFEHVIPEITRKLYKATDNWSKAKCQLKIEGTGEETRAFCYVEDAVSQLMVILEKGISGEIYHIGMDEEITIKQLIQDMAQALSIKIEIVTGEIKKGSTSRRCPSIEKIRCLGYAKNNHYLEGLKNTLEWYKEYFSCAEILAI